MTPYFTYENLFSERRETFVYIGLSAGVFVLNSVNTSTFSLKVLILALYGFRFISHYFKIIYKLMTFLNVVPGKSAMHIVLTISISFNTPISFLSSRLSLVGITSCTTATTTSDWTVLHEMALALFTNHVNNPPCRRHPTPCRSEYFLNIPAQHL